MHKDPAIVHKSFILVQIEKLYILRKIKPRLCLFIKETKKRNKKKMKNITFSVTYTTSLALFETVHQQLPIKTNKKEKKREKKE